MASSSSYVHTTHPSSSQTCIYDTFLSFRGEDTRKTFVDHLYTYLVDRKISTYKDNETLPRGESIRPSLFNAIEGSRIAVVIFSENYADSSWCLDELTHIMKCKNERELIVMPIFYGVTPSEVRKQEGEFGKGFVKQKEKEENNSDKVESWKKALVGACEISGWETKNVANGHESKAITEIVDTISDKLFPVALGVDEDLVGMTTRVQELEARLEIGSQDVRMVGIWGVGGSGKTTLASSLSKKISRHFQGHCIVDNIREDTIKHGLKVLQQRIISRLLKIEMDLQDVEEGKRTISRLSRSNVLIILDDVDDRKQLEALAGSHNWFGSGSRIIITTRNEHLLHKANLIYPIKLLSDEEAIQLFNIRAYNVNAPLNDYNTLSLCVVSYAARLPLALKVLGSFLYDKNEMEWRSALDRLKVIPQTEIMEQLKSSYDGLESDEKELFLDIACFFRWEVEDKAMEILEACGYHYHIGIKVLRQKALITIVDGMFDMHDLVQEMGHYIVRRKHPNDPSKHSRVWKDEEIRNMCLSDATMDNDKIEAIGCRRYPDDSSLFYRFVSNMKKLRYLYAEVGCRFSHDEVDEIVEGPKFLSNELRYMELMNYPSTPFPNTFKPVKLVILKLKWSLPKHLWNGYKHFPQLKVLHLQHMTNLLSTPDFDGLPSLQKLTLNDCKSLEKIHSSLGKHSSLEHLSVCQCWKLTMFPTIVGMRKLKTLEIIGLDDWTSNFEFPEIKSNMESLVKLSLTNIGIDALLSSLGERCPSLISVRLFSCFYLRSIEEVNFDGLKHLEEFKLCALLHRRMPNESGHRLFTMPIMLSMLSCN